MRPDPRAMLAPAMRHPPTPRRARRWAPWLLVAGTALAGFGCRANVSGSSAPARPVSLEDIDAELGRNEAALADAGIVVPPSQASAPEPPPPQPEAAPTTPSISPPADAPDPGPPAVTPTPSTSVDAAGVAAGSDDNEDAPELTSRASSRDESIEAEYARESKRGRRKRGGRRRFKKKSREEREPSRCDRVCDLADSTCSLAGHVCGLAERHVTDLRYQESCRRAERQCDAAIAACRACR